MLRLSIQTLYQVPNVLIQTGYQVYIKNGNHLKQIFGVITKQNDYVNNIHVYPFIL